MLLGIIQKSLLKALETLFCCTTSAIFMLMRYAWSLCSLFSSCSHKARETLPKIHVIPEKFFLAWLVWSQSCNVAVTVQAFYLFTWGRSVIIQNWEVSIFYRNKRDLSPERELLQRCFCAVAVAGEWQSCYSVCRPDELLYTRNKQVVT